MTARKIPPSGSMQATAHERVYAELRQGLMNGDFIPGQRLVVRKIAERFETSAMPVREALRRLVSEEALFDHSNRGVIVPEASVDVISDIVRVRCLIEGSATEWAAATITLPELEAIDELNERMKACTTVDGSEKYLAFNRQFHFQIYRAARSVATQQIIERLWLRAGPWLNIMRGEATLGLGLDYHAEILAALRAGDGVKARRALVADISDAADMMLRAASAPPPATGRTSARRRAAMPVTQASR
ncbi:GntR family transcriptional regulator [Mesorhizobium sp. YM1C-6-2]|jgi:DNA-binding GntR family transcriptional regulator|uniref:GntR family transcriptional regulator n=1 Tax=Mesorhizobium sp. YM1C-6-2 TaxID=1827501 RepID=UPI000EF24145|nr:GntR family transcriptional regulator [Mesorhizobium sp. YM1C-6-2]RLP25857.1 GntR family transcriptional regulator [Mesorhizobium sp. YM1C-6-2]